MPPRRFRRAVTDCQRVLPHTGIPLAGAHGTGTPLFGPDAVVFNGAGAHGHETFAIRRVESERPDGRPSFSFCKTEHKPYDRAVQVALIVFQHHVGGQFRVGSDGTDADWNAARQLCQQVLGYGAAFRLDHG